METEITIDGQVYVRKNTITEQPKQEEKIIGLAIKNRFTGSIIFQSSKTTYREAVDECVKLASKNGTRANLTDANLTDANLTRANLTGANLTACQYYMGAGNKNFETLCKYIKTIKWNSNTGADFIK